MDGTAFQEKCGFPCARTARLGCRSLTLSTDPDPRAARFCPAAGWREGGRTPEGALVFEHAVTPL